MQTMSTSLRQGEETVSTSRSVLPISQRCTLKTGLVRRARASHGTVE